MSPSLRTFVIIDSQLQFRKCVHRAEAAVGVVALVAFVMHAWLEYDTHVNRVVADWTKLCSLLDVLWVFLRLRDGLL